MRQAVIAISILLWQIHGQGSEGAAVGVDIQDNAGAVRFGAAGDVSIYRAGANVLRTDNVFLAAGLCLFAVVFHAHAGNSTLGNSASNALTINAKLQGATPLVFEGATVNGHHTNLAVTDPSATRTITLPDASGQVVLQDSHGNVVVPGNITAGSQQLNLLDEVLQVRQFLQSVVLSPTTVWVGAGKQFSTLLSAVTWASSKFLAAQLTIQVAAGTYTMAPLLIEHLPAPHLLVIQGNLTNPDSVKLVCSGAGCSTSFITLDVGTNGLVFGGFSLSTTTPGSGIGIWALFSSTVFVNAVHISNFQIGIVSETGTTVMSTSFTITNCYTGILVENAAGFQFTTLSTYAITGNGASGSYGVQVQNGGSVVTNGVLTVSNVTTGLGCSPDIGNYIFQTGTVHFGANVAAQYTAGCPNGFLITSSTTITVGPTGQFQTIDAAVTYLMGMIIAAPVTIQLQDGTYSTTSGFQFGYFNANAQIYVQGNVADKSKVVIQCAGACCTATPCYLIRAQPGSDSIVFTQLTVSGTGCSNCIGIYAINGGRAQFTNCAMSGVLIAAWADSGTFLSVGYTDPSCSSSASACGFLLTTGPCPCYYATGGAFLAVGGTVTGSNTGIAVFAEGGGISAGELVINNFATGVQCTGAGQVEIAGAPPTYTSVTTHCSCTNVGPQSC